MSMCKSVPNKVLSECILRSKTVHYYYFIIETLWVGKMADFSPQGIKSDIRQIIELHVSDEALLCHRKEG